MQLLDLIGESLFHELHGAYRPVFDMVMALERDFPKVALNQIKFDDTDAISMFNAQAHMLYTMQGHVPEADRKTRRQLRDALQVLETIPGTRSAMVKLLVESFAATVYMVEHLFFINRELERRIDAGELKEYTKDDAVYPKERIDDLVALTYKVWKADYVLQDAGKK